MAGPASPLDEIGAGPAHFSDRSFLLEAGLETAREHHRHDPDYDNLEQLSGDIQKALHRSFHLFGVFRRNAAPNILVARKGTRPLGYIFLQTWPDAMFVLDIYVISQFRRFGLARTLLAAAERRWPNRDFHASVRPWNTASRCLFAVAGFALLEDRQGKSLLLKKSALRPPR